jgi:hypothetical protein
MPNVHRSINLDGPKFERKTVRMSSFPDSFAVLAMAVVFAGCAQPSKPEPVERAAAAGSSFDAVGSVMLHAGQPCTIQIMFDFRRTKSKSTVWLAAPMRETTILTDAARDRRRVHIVGKWRRGRQTGCSYVDVATAELQR